MTPIRCASALAIAVMLAASAATAQQPERPSADLDENRLARAVQNPISKLGALPVQNQAELGIGPFNRVRNTLSILPMIGIALSRDVSIVSRTKLPFVSRPEVDRESGSTSGLGDVTQSLFVIPDSSSRLVWGLGPSFLLPTASSVELGSGKLGIGPTAAALARPKPWTFGAVVGQMWSVAGPSNRADVSQLSVMPLVSVQFPSGWYVTTAPIITANWNAAAARSVWTVPLGGACGKVLVVGSLPINVSVGAYWNVIRPDTAFAPTATAELQVALLFPR